MKATAVIGSMFGDEGKGRIVDQLVYDSKSLCAVVRYNGGAQAGHRVELNDGRKHSFSHVGAGSFGSAPTFLSKFFIANPFLFSIEIKNLNTLYVNPVIFIDPQSPLTTYYDMLLNRDTETARGHNRHGSCGYGVSETVHRLCNTPYHIYAHHLSDMVQFKKILANIRQIYFVNRLNELGLENKYDDQILDIADAEYIKNVALFAMCVKIRPVSILNQFDEIIFEGAQGLGLDERHKYFPHVTRSKTGIDNIQIICNELSIGKIDGIYVSRTYATRHGNGPFPTENPAMDLKDPANPESEWQGRMRFGDFDHGLITLNIKKDLARGKNIEIAPSMAFTCADQFPVPDYNLWPIKYVTESRERNE